MTRGGGVGASEGGRPARSWLRRRPRTRPARLRADKSNFGHKMLERMGWSEGKGLGRKEQGSSVHVRVVRRDDSLGA